MGYYNPIYARGVPRFLAEATAAGVDGLIVVDLPPEEDDELCLPAQAAGLNFIRLATPTTDDRRLPAVLTNTSGFVYYVSITGITGAAAADAAAVAPEVARIKAATALPVCVGFGIRTPEAAAEIAASPTAPWSARRSSSASAPATRPKRCWPSSAASLTPHTGPEQCRRLAPWQRSARRPSHRRRSPPCAPCAPPLTGEVVSYTHDRLRSRRPRTGCRARRYARSRIGR